MKISDLLALCLCNLTRRKFRTFLTVMGVVIGTCAIVVMISLGVGISVAQEEYLSSIGDLTVIQVYSRGSGTERLLDDDALAAIAQIPGVQVATPFMTFRPEEGYTQLYAGRKERFMVWGSYSILGVNPDALGPLGFEVDEGELLTADSGGKKFQMLFGNQFAYEFEDTKKRWPNNYIYGWPDENGNRADPFFQPFEEGYALKVYAGKENEKPLVYEGECVGILKEGNYEWQCLVDLDTLKAIKADYEKANNIKKDKDSREEYEEVRVKVDNVRNVGAVQAAIEDDLQFYCNSLEDIRKTMEESAQQIQLILGILGGVSLFVAAISITNTMIMSVYERTREIGVMKVLGCMVGNIRAIFLVEAGMIGFIGGVTGIGLSYLLSYLLNTFGGMLGSMMDTMSMEGSKVSIIPPWLVVLGLVFATLIGLISGFQPANRAVKISALEAIRTE